MKKLYTYMILILFFHINCYAGNNKIEISDLRGINVSLHATVEKEDLKKISEWGANFIRIVVQASPDRKDYDNVFINNKLLNDDFLKKLDNLILMAGRNNLKVVICTASFPGWRKDIWSDYKYWNQLVYLWKILAERYKHSNIVIGYAPIDEPSVVRVNSTAIEKLMMRQGHWTYPTKWLGTEKDYFSLVEKIGKMINAIDQKKYIAVSGVGIWSFPINFKWMKTVDVKNVVYTFNLYGKFANSGKKGKAIIKYDKSRDFDQLQKSLQPVIDFANHYNAKIMINGFGLSYHTEKMGAMEWMNNIIGFFENQNWGWAYFSYSVPFRNPEVVDFISHKNIIKRSDTERLKVLKKYWKRNKNLFKESEYR